MMMVSVWTAPLFLSAVESIETELRPCRLVDCTNIERRVRRKGRGEQKTLEVTIAPQARMKSKTN